jgi:hypothetical protein
MHVGHQARGQIERGAIHAGLTRSESATPFSTVKRVVPTVALPEMMARSRGPQKAGSGRAGAPVAINSAVSAFSATAAGASSRPRNVVKAPFFHQ